jgi:hypothetical protein
MTPHTKLSPCWTRTAGSYKGQVYFTHDSGWTVRHCGHPTANWPYFIQHPRLHAGCEVVSFNGRGFKSAEIARSVVEMILDNRLQVTAEGCVPRIRRVLCTAYGQIITA